MPYGYDHDDGHGNKSIQRPRADCQENRSSLPPNQIAQTPPASKTSKTSALIPKANTPSHPPLTSPYFTHSIPARSDASHHALYCLTAALLLWRLLHWVLLTRHGQISPINILSPFVIGKLGFHPMEYQRHHCSVPYIAALLTYSSSHPSIAFNRTIAVR